MNNIGNANILRVFILISVLIQICFFPLITKADSAHYAHIGDIIKNFYAQNDSTIAIEPHGSRAADILGSHKDGNKIVGEIKKAVEIERDLEGYWSQWNSKQSFGGKTSDYKLADQYTDKGVALSRSGRGWSAVIDGQLRGYCVKELFGRGDLVVENYGKYEKDILESLNYLKEQGRIKSFEIEKVPNSNISRIRIVFDKMPPSVIMPKQSNKKINKASNIENKTSSVQQKQNIAKPTVEIKNPSVFSKIMSKVVKASIVVSVITSGYTIAQETYDQKMAGKQVHPSRILVRIVMGILGGIACGFLLGAFLGLIFSWFPPAGIVAGIVGAVAGAILGAIGAEWLFELIIPYHGTGWAICDFLLGGLLGSIMGTFFGFVLGWWDACRGNEGGFLKAIFTLLILAPLNAIGGAIGGFFFGGFVGSLLFWFMFNMT